MGEEDWYAAGSPRLHALRAGDATHRTPLVYVPGALGSAEDFRPEMQRLSPRPTVAISPRGFGRSSAPESGYGLEDRARDLDRVLSQLALPPACVMAFSVGVPVALLDAARHPHRVAGLILLDYPARYPKFTDAWVEHALDSARRRGVPDHVVYRLQEESRATELWSELDAVDAPVVVVKGGESTAISTEDLDRYRRSLSDVRIEVFEEAGHEVFRPDYERFMRTVEAFLRDLDTRA